MLRYLAAGAFAAAIIANPAQAQNYPSKSIRLIVAYSAGGTGDTDRKSVV